jgi:hypothetical protein
LLNGHHRFREHSRESNQHDPLGTHLFVADLVCIKPPPHHGKFNGFTLQQTNHLTRIPLHHLQPDPWTGSAETAEQIRDQAGGRNGACPNPQSRLFKPLKAPDRNYRFSTLTADSGSMFIKQPASFSQGDATDRTVKQPRPKLVFKRPDMLTCRGLGQADNLTTS